VFCVNLGEKGLGFVNLGIGIENVVKSYFTPLFYFSLLQTTHPSNSSLAQVSLSKFH